MALFGLLLDQTPELCRSSSGRTCGFHFKTHGNLCLWIVYNYSYFETHSWEANYLFKRAKFRTEPMESSGISGLASPRWSDFRS